MVILVYKMYINLNHTLDDELNEEWKKNDDEKTIVNELILTYLVDFVNIPVKVLIVKLLIFL